MPSLLATAAVHHHLVREGTRLKIGLVAETGEAREIHHLACLIGYGNSAVNPYVMFESVYSLHRAGPAAGRHEPRGGRAAGGQGDRQGPAEGALEDGHLHDPLLHRRPDLRGGGARARARGPALHRHLVADRRRGARGARRARRSTATRAPTRRPPPSCCPPPASTSGAAAACSTAGTRRRSRASSTRRATATARRPTSASPAT